MDLTKIIKVTKLLIEFVCKITKFFRNEENPQKEKDSENEKKAS